MARATFTRIVLHLLVAAGVLLITASVVHSSAGPAPDCHNIKCPAQLSCDRRDQVQNGANCCPTCGGTLGQYCDYITFCRPDLVCIRTNPRSSAEEGVCISRSTETSLSQVGGSHKRYLGESSEFENYNKDTTTAYSNSTTEKNHEHKHGDHQGYTRETVTASAYGLEQRHHEEGHGYGDFTTPAYNEGYMDKRHQSEGHVAEGHESPLSDDAALIKLLMKLLKSD